MRRILVAMLVLAALGLPSATFAAEQCFPNDKTPYCLKDQFNDYWNTNGGLPVFGYPLSTVADEWNADAEVIFPTQWLERNRFEYHVENKGTPYEVLLGLLGKEALAIAGRDWAAEPRESGPKPGCLWFEQTGHNVCNQSGGLGFKAYWETHGLKIAGLDAYAQSLQLFGLPLTSPMTETNSSGDTVLTQWFERARFEWHPNNPDEFKVLLGLLGKEVTGGQPGLMGEILYARYTATDPLASDLYAIAADGSNLRRLTSTPSDLELIDDVAEDGTLLLEVGHTDASDAGWYLASANRDGSGLTALTNRSGINAGGEWSPDGSKVVFTSAFNNQTDIYIINRDTTGLLRLTDHAADDYAPTWSPDGKKIAFVSERTGDGDVYVINADGTGLTNVTTSTGWDGDPQWTSDSKSLLISSARGYGEETPLASDLYLVTVATGAATRLTSDLAEERWAAFSPDGTWIVFSYFDGSGVVSGDIGGGDLVLLSSDGKTRRMLTPEATGGREPVWSPDGSHIAYTSARNDDAALWLWSINVLGTQVTLLDNADDAVTQPVWLDN